MTAFIDEHRGRFGVEPICRTLDVSASAYYLRKTGARAARVIEDERLLERIFKLHADNYYAYGHAHITTTMRYVHHRPGADDAARLSSAFRGDVTAPLVSSDAEVASGSSAS